jgi:hypothetical protein
VDKESLALPSCLAVCAMACCHLTMEAQVHSEASPCGVMLNKVALGQQVFLWLLQFPLSLFNQCFMLVHVQLTLQSVKDSVIK